MKETATKNEVTFVSKFELVFFYDDDDDDDDGVRQVKFLWAQGCLVSVRRHPLSVLGGKNTTNKININETIQNQIVDCTHAFLS